MLRPLLITRQDPWLQISTEYPRIYIDGKKQWAEIGLAGPMELMSQIEDRGKQDCLEGIRAWARQGDFLARGGSYNNWVKGRRQAAQKEINVDVWPSEPVAIQAELGSVAMEYYPGHVEVQLGRIDTYA
ncbi:MAG: DUF6470 family protein [Limnochordia bacterium]|jgi:hypothetical protein